MQFETLKVFCDVARHRSMSQAAAENDITQSAASQMVLHLEKRLGVQLVNRSTRPLQLTTLGQTYYEGCKNLVEQYLELESSIRKADAQLVSTVEVAAIYSVGLGDMGQRVEQFVAEHPAVKVHVEYLHPDRVYEKVLVGTADLGLVSFPRKSRELAVLPWREEAMVLACAPGHRLATFKTVKPSQLAGEKFIGFNKGLTIRRHVERFLRVQGVSVDMALEFDNIESIKKAVEESAGVAFLPEPTLRREIEAGTLVARSLAGCHFTRPLGIIHRRHHRLTANASRFIDLLRHSDEATNGKEPSRNGLHHDPKQRRNAPAAASV